MIPSTESEARLRKVGAACRSAVVYRQLGKQGPNSIAKRQAFERTSIGIMADRGRGYE